jgi:IS30 family transposase
MTNYKHLTKEERYQIQVYKKTGFSQVEIAKELIVHKYRISRKLKRNSTKVDSSASRI